MRQFTNIQDLQDYIERDIVATSICPVRFINVETMDVWVKVKSFLSQRCSITMALSNYCEADDVTPNLRRLFADLRNINENTLLVPISEHLRIKNPIAEKTLNDLLNMSFISNDCTTFRLYIPLYRMKSLLSKLLLTPRNYDSVICVESITDPDYSLTVIQDTLHAKIYGNEITGYKEYLMYWEQNPDKPIILHTQNAIHFSDIVFADDVRVIINSYDLLAYHYKLPKTIKQEWGGDEQWNLLLSKYEGPTNLDDVLARILHVRDFDVSLFSNWKTKDDATRWVIWLWAKQKAGNGYLSLVMMNEVCVNNFTQAIFCAILSVLDDNNYTSLYAERLSLITDMKIQPPIEFWIKYENLSALDKIKVLTALTEKEQMQFFILLGELPINETTCSILAQNYPALSRYLQPLNFENTLFTDYFNQYKLQKALNKVDEGFLQLVNDIATDQCEVLWQLPSRNAAVSKVYDDESIILFVDALGAEYASLLTEMLREHNLYLEPPIYAYCNIPSTTEMNKDFLEGRNVEKCFDLDSIKHSGELHPKNLIKEFNILRAIVDRVIGLFSDKVSQVIIASDHGTSRLAVLAKGKTFEAGANAMKYKYGRYCIDQSDDYSEFFGCINRDNYWIFANYSRFASQGAPLLETHGGATLEECIVHIFSVRKSAPKQKTKEIITVTLLTSEAKMTLDQTATISFSLSKQLTGVSAKVDNKYYECRFDGSNYSYTQNVGRETTYTAQIVSGGIIGAITYKVVKGISSKFDI
jgi:hypothetical protein